MAVVFCLELVLALVLLVLLGGRMESPVVVRSWEVLLLVSSLLLVGDLFVFFFCSPLGLGR